MSGLVLHVPSSRAWRRLFSAFVISATGDEFSRIALLARTYELGGSVRSLTWMVLAQVLPSLVLSPLVGALSDRGRKRNYMVITDGARSLLMVVIALSTSLSQTIVLTAALSTFGAVFRPVEASLEADLLPAEDIARANPLRVATRQLLMIAGPALVGAFLTVFSARSALLADAASYGLSALLLASLPRDPVRERSPKRAGPAPSLRRELGEGLSYIARGGSMRLLFFAHVILVLLLGMQGPLLYDFVVSRLGGSGREYGFLMTALGAGAALGSLSFGRWPGLRQHGTTVLFAALLADGLGLLAFTYGRSLAACAPAMGLMGLISAAFQIIIRSALQTRPPPELRGRVIGWFEGVQGPLSVLSSFVVLYLTTRWSSTNILRGAALAELSAALVSVVLLLWLERTK
jgi:MFS family permease